MSGLAGYDDLDSFDDDERVRSGKRARTSIARQACEVCRARKTRCDQDTPCSLCRSLGCRCVYTERKPTRNEASFSTISNRLRRIETKIDRISQTCQPTTNEPDSASALALSTQHGNDASAQVSTPPQPLQDSTPKSLREDVELSFGSRQMLHWPGLSVTSFPLKAQELGLQNCDTAFDEPVSTGIVQDEVFPSDWLDNLGLSTIKALSNAFFATFNRIFPFIDRDHFAHHTLTVVVADGFNYDVESCLVLGVMALGCLGIKAFEEGGYENEDLPPSTDIMQHLMRQTPPGKTLFDESRRRSASFASNFHDIQVSQYYLTASLFFGQAMMRPLDQWLMTDRASTNCLIFWNHLRNRSDGWSVDMQTRIFWCALLIDTVVVQELDLPTSRLRALEDVVPLPKFIANPNIKRQVRRRDDSYYHYHFLAQIAHRIILLRIRDETFYLHPSTKVAAELRQQLENWYANLPPALQFGSLVEFSCPAEALAMSLLQTRYRSAVYHLGRPFLYKAIHDPSSITERELQFCADALQCTYDWPIASGTCRQMMSFAPLKFTTCRAFFGILLIFYAIMRSDHESLRRTLPPESEAACKDMLQYMQDLSPENESTRKDHEFLAILYAELT